MDAGAWWAAVYGVAQSPTWLKQLSSSVYNKLSLVKVLHCYLLLSVSNGPSFWLLPLFLSSVSSLHITTTGLHQSSAVAKYPFLLAKAPYSSFPLSPDSCCCCCSVASVPSNSVQPHRRQPTRLPHPWDSPGKNTGVGCHFLLQCRKVKSESEVTQ